MRRSQMLPTPPAEVNAAIIGSTAGVLIGTFEGDSRLNNYFDGPFGQLPQNFIQARGRAIIRADPNVKGQIDRQRSARRAQMRDRQAPRAVVLPLLRRR